MSVLYVDNDHEAQPVLARFLATVGPLSTASTLEAARAALAKAPPALLVIDPALPDGDGTELIAALRASHPWAQVFVVPRTTWADQVARFIAAGANDVAVKPFDVGKLALRASALLRAAESARREMEYRVQLETRLAHVERIATLGTMLATVAHEVATPLTLINANTAILGGALRSGGSLETSRPEISSAASEIRVAAGMIQTIVQRIRMFSRRDERRRVTAPLVQVVDTALLLIKPLLLGRSITIKPPQGTAPIVPHYPIRLTQALINILTNAVEAIGQGREGHIVLSWLDNPDDAGIAVDDDGRGLSDEARSRVFEPFFTSKAEGTGLGLVLVRAIMREHDGSFELRPATAGQGVSARLILPKAVEDRPTMP